VFNRTFYHGTLKKYVVLFGTLFNSTWINRIDSHGNIKQSFKVPISYSPREKFLARITGMQQEKDPLKQPFAISLPRMGFEITSFAYAAERKLTTINRFAKQNTEDGNIRQFQYNPVPYDITFDLSIYVKNTEDGTMIIEQILPYFTPEWTTTAQLIENPNITLDVPLVLNAVTNDEIYEGGFEERRVIIWTLSFTMKAFFFGPTRKQGVIKLANANLYDSTLFDNIFDSIGQLDALSRITITPGMTANGEPTTDPDETIDKDLINSDDNWTYIVEVTNPALEE
jgi:hypothetical protein